MALARARRTDRRVDYWPGFVDAMATLLLAIMFLLSVFVLAQYFLSQEITGKDAVLDRLNAQINELTQLLALEQANSQDAEDTRRRPERLAQRAGQPAQDGESHQEHQGPSQASAQWLNAHWRPRPTHGLHIHRPR